MIAAQLIDIAMVETMNFSNNDIPDWNGSKPASSFRLTAQDLDDLPDDRNLDEFRCRLAELLEEKLQRNYAKVEAECDIKQDTFRRMLRGQRQPTYMQVAKFCVGAKLTLGEADELFLLIGHELSTNSRADYILMCELRNGCDITEYDADMRKYCNRSIYAE